MLKSKSAIGPVVASALLLVVAVVAVVGFQTWFGSYSSNTFTKVEMQSNSDESIQIEKIIGNTIYLKNPQNSSVSLSKLKVGNIDCDINQNLSYGITGIDISSCLAQITSKSQNIVAYTNKAVVSKNLYISDWDSTTPYLSLTSNWTTIPYNTSVNLSWSGNNLNTCLASGDWNDIKSTSSSEVISNLISNSTFTLECTSNTVNVSKSIDIVVTDLPIISFSAENSSIPFNSSTNLVWSVIGADTCVASGNWSESIGTSGTYNTSNLDVSGNHSYNLTCSGFGGESSSSVIITVAEDVTLLTISSSTNDYNLFVALGSPTIADNYIITINNGVIIGSTSTTTSAFTTGTLPIGSTVKIINNGRIQGKGGNGRNLNHGEQGGDALNLNFEVTIDNTNGEIWSGGGGGGACAGGYGIPGGGAGTDAGTNAGTSESGGAGIAQSGYSAGDGGDPGQAGGASQFCGIVTYQGGAAGDSIQTNGNTITWLGGNSSPNLKGPIN